MDENLKPIDLVEVSRRGNVDAVERILEMYPTQVDIQVRGVTAMHVAASQGHIEVMKTLIRHEADLEATDLDYATPLHYAVRGNQDRAVYQLLKSGAKMDETDKDDMTPPQYAFQNKLKECIKVFQEYNPSVKFKKASDNPAFFTHEESLGPPDPDETMETDNVENNDADYSEEDSPKEGYCKYCMKTEATITFEPCGCVVSCFECSLSRLTCECGEPIEKRSYNESKELSEYIAKLQKMKTTITDLRKSIKKCKLEQDQSEKENEVLRKYTVCRICMDYPIKATFLCGHMYCIICAKRIIKDNFGECGVCHKQSRYTVLYPEWPTPYIEK